MLNLASKIFIGFISFFFLGLSIHHPVLKDKQNGIPLRHRFAIILYFINLVWAVGGFFHTFSIYWGTASLIMMVAFVIWILRENQLLEVYFMAKFQRNFLEHSIESLYYQVLKEDWEKILNIFEGTDPKVLKSSRKQYHLFLLSKSYALIKLGRGEEAMEILFEVLDDEHIELEVKEGIKFQLTLLQNQTLIA
jgi:hypothetical protein